MYSILTSEYSGAQKPEFLARFLTGKMGMTSLPSPTDSEDSGSGGGGTECKHLSKCYRVHSSFTFYCVVFNFCIVKIFK